MANKQAGILEPPPAMVKDIGEWVQAQVAANQLASIEQSLESEKQRPARMKDQYEPLAEAIKVLRKEIPAGAPKVLFNAAKQFAGEVIGQWGFGWAREPKVQDYQKLDPEKRQLLVDRLTQNIEKVEERMQDDIRNTKRIVELEKEAAKLHPFLRPGVSPMTGDKESKKFPVDLSGWRYGADTIKEALIKSRVKSIQDSIGDMDLTPFPEIKAKMDKRLEEAKVHGGWESIWVSLTLKSDIKGAGGWWQSANKALSIMVDQQVYPWHITGQLMDTLHHELQHMSQDILRDAVAANTDWLDFGTRDRKPVPGMPSRHIMTPTFHQEDKRENTHLQRYRRPEDMPPSTQDIHALDDIEFHTELKGAVQDLKQLLADLDQHQRQYEKRPATETERKALFKWAVGAGSKIEGLGYHHPLKAMVAWKRLAPGKWRFAVKELTKEFQKMPIGKQAKSNKGAIERVASMWLSQPAAEPRVAGILEYPPMLKKDIWAWVKKTFASHVLYTLHPKLLQISEWQTFKPEQLQKYKKLLTEAPKKIRDLKEGDTFTFTLGDGEDIYRHGVRRDDDNYGQALYSVASDVASEPLNYYDGGDLSDVLRFAEDLINAAIIELQGKDSPFDDNTLISIKALQKECLKFADGPVPLLAGMHSDRFKVDTTGWQYKPSEIWSQGIRVVLFPETHPDRAGQWDVVNKELQIDVQNQDILSVRDFYTELGRLEETLDHELRHVAQSLLSGGRDFNRGVPSKNLSPQHRLDLPSDPWQPEELAHSLREEEFYTRLGDDIRTFLLKIRQIPKPLWRMALKAWVGSSDWKSTFGHEFRLKASEFFSMLKKYQPNKWRKAVSEFEKAVNQKIDIPSEDNDLVYLPGMDSPTRISPFGKSPLNYWNARAAEIGGASYARGTRAERDKLENDIWPEVKKEYAKFIDHLSPAQLLKHKQDVQKPGKGSMEYYLTERWQKFNGTNQLAEPPRDSKNQTIVPPHPKLPKN